MLLRTTGTDATDATDATTGSGCHNNDNYCYPRWFQMTCIVYGSHTATTLVPILPTICFRSDEEAPVEMRVLLCVIYLPYFVFPAWIAAIAACDPGFTEQLNSINNNIKIKGR